MARKKIVTLMLMIIIVVSLTGCWDSKDINEKRIATAVIVDKIDKDFYFYIECPDLKQAEQTSNEEKESQFILIHGKGETFIEARADLDNKLGKPTFLGSVRTLVFTNDMAKHGFTEYIHRLQNMVVYRKAIGIVTTSTKVDDLSTSENDEAIGYAIEEIIETLTSSGQAVKITTSQILELFYCKNICFIIPNIDIKNQHLALTGYTVIVKGKYRGFIPIKESNGLVFFLNDKAEFKYIVPFGENEATVNVQIKKRTITPYYSDDIVILNAEFTFESIVKNLDRDVPFDEEASLEVKENLQKLILDDLYNTVYQSKHKFGCEYLDFDEPFRIRYPNEYEEMDWTEEYLNATVHISVKTSLDPGGMMDFNPPEK